MEPIILIVEDDALQREMLHTLLNRKLNIFSLTAENGRKALDILDTHNAKHIQLVILDIKMPVMGGLETLKIIKEKHPAIAVIMLSGSKDIEDAILAIRLGAIDFINKPFESERMITTVRNALKIGLLSKEVKRLSNINNKTSGFEALIGANQGLKDVVAQGKKAAFTNIPVLLTGETGTGKEIFATALHGESERSGKPFIAVNCGAIPHQLAESVLFGHEKGAFTGASEKTIGKFREAQGGTIFLDEVGELPLDTQVKLLRALQQKEVEPAGATKPIPVDVRIISATNRNLEDEVIAGRFREDLYYRLNVIHIHMPPLRNRKDDITALALHFADRFSARENISTRTLSSALINKLTEQYWPGNVRELENSINRALAMGEDTTFDMEPIKSPNITLSGMKAIQNNCPSQQIIKIIDIYETTGQLKTIDQIEAEAMIIALNIHEGNITQSAKSLGIAKSTFYKKMTLYGISPNRNHI